MNTPVLEDITTHAEALDDTRLNELAEFALRVKAGTTAPRVEFDNDPVLALLKMCMSLSLADKRRLNAQFATIVRNEGARLGVA